MSIGIARSNQTTQVKANNAQRLGNAQSAEQEIIRILQTLLENNVSKIEEDVLRLKVSGLVAIKGESKLSQQEKVLWDRWKSAIIEGNKVVTSPTNSSLKPAVVEPEAVKTEPSSEPKKINTALQALLNISRGTPGVRDKDPHTAAKLEFERREAKREEG